MEEREFMRMERKLKEIGPQADFLGNGNYQQETAIIIKIFLVEEREFMRMERELKKIGPQGGRGWRTTGTNEDNVVMGDE